LPLARLCREVMISVANQNRRVQSSVRKGTVLVFFILESKEISGSFEDIIVIQKGLCRKVYVVTARSAIGASLFGVTDCPHNRSHGHESGRERSNDHGTSCIC
jgi:hypothetical protein